MKRIRQIDKPPVLVELGALLAGPESLMKDHHSWSDASCRRICSWILHSAGADSLVISVYFPAGDGASIHQREALAEEMAARLVFADLPAVIMGDWNAHPHAFELNASANLCQLAHEAVGVDCLSTASSCLDFAFVRHLPGPAVGL